MKMEKSDGKHRDKNVILSVRQRDKNMKKLSLSLVKKEGQKHKLRFCPRDRQKHIYKYINCPCPSRAIGERKSCVSFRTTTSFP